MPKDLLLFSLFFFLPMLWFRINFLISRDKFLTPIVRTKTNLTWHHLHYGAIAVLLGSIAILIYGKSNAVVVLLGLGLGLIFDLFIPSLLLKTNREEELIVYGKSLKPTIVLFTLVVLTLLVIYVLI